MSVLRIRRQPLLTRRNGCALQGPDYRWKRPERDTVRAYGMGRHRREPKTINGPPRGIRTRGRVGHESCKADESLVKREVSITACLRYSAQDWPTLRLCRACQSDRPHSSLRDNYTLRRCQCAHLHHGGRSIFVFGRSGTTAAASSISSCGRHRHFHSFCSAHDTSISSTQFNVMRFECVSDPDPWGDVTQGLSVGETHLYTQFERELDR